MMEEGATGKEATTRRESQIRLDCIGSTSIIQREWGKQKERETSSFFPSQFHSDEREEYRVRGFRN